MPLFLTSVCLSTIVTCLSFTLAWDYLFSSYIGMHPAAAVTLTLVCWLLTWASYRLATDSVIDTLNNLQWPKLD